MKKDDDIISLELSREDMQLIFEIFVRENFRPASMVVFADIMGDKETWSEHDYPKLYEAIASAVINEVVNDCVERAVEEVENETETD